MNAAEQYEELDKPQDSQVSPHEVSPREFQDNLREVYPRRFVAISVVVAAFVSATASGFGILSGVFPLNPFTVTPTSNLLKRVRLVEEDPLAVCNDGSPASYFWKRGSDTKSWFMFLEAGGWCWDLQSCIHRPNHMRSDEWRGDAIDVFDGIMSQNSPAGNFNIIFIPYCSSDAHMADVGEHDTEIGIPFRGARIVRSAIKHAIKTWGIGDDDLFVFGGASAGARGAMVHLDTLKPSGLIPKTVNLLGYLDSPYYINMRYFKEFTDPDHRVADQTRIATLNMKIENILKGNGLCHLEDVWKCGFGEHRIPLLRSRFLLVASMYDSYQVHVATGAQSVPFPSDAYNEFVDEFANRTKDGLRKLPQLSSGRIGFLSSTCYEHAVSESQKFTDEFTMHMSMRQALARSINVSRGIGGEMPKVIEKCFGLNCGEGCS